MNSEKAKAERDAFVSANGHTEISFNVFHPAAPPSAIVQIVHGMSEHMGRYGEFCEYLAENGIAVCGADCLGHGKSVRDGETYGYFGEEADAYTFLAKDNLTLSEIIKKRYPALPFIMLGHSMGSFIARDFAERFGDRLDGLILSGTSSGDEPLSLAIFLASAIGIFGKKKKSELLRKLSTGRYNDSFDGKTGCEWITSDLARLENYNSDPSCGFTFTAKGYRDMFMLLKSVTRPEWAYSVPKSLSVLLTSGSCDPVGNMGKGVKKVYDSLVSAGVKNAEMKLWEGDRHEILNEKNRAEVYSYLREKINIMSGETK